MPGFDARRNAREQRRMKPSPRPRITCINCHKARKSVIIVQALTPDGKGYEVAASVPICVPCLRLPLPGVPLAGYLADEVGDPRNWF